jgi:hypothetical protein
MSHLNTAYKIGALKAALEKLGTPRKKKTSKKTKKLQPVSLRGKRRTASRTASGGSRFGALKRKLAKKNTRGK